MDEADSHTVEIAIGGRDYSNPDMLVAKYEGEGEEYSDPIKAVGVAIEIAATWKKESPKLRINIAYGNTGGYTMPFESSNQKKLKEWAKKLFNSLRKCDQCGELIEGDGWVLSEFPDQKFCQDSCAERFLNQVEEEVA